MMSGRNKSRLRIANLAAGAALLTACSAGMAQKIAPTGTPLTQQERAQGSKYHPDLVTEYGGEMSGPHADYVKGVGKKIALQSGLSTNPADYNVTLLNSPVNNAFAIPGGYVYVTRQLVALMNNEAELAGVLGHEVGHVAARHSAKRQSTAQRNQILGVLGQVLSGVVFGNSALGHIGQQVASTVPQLATLRYSRKQELQADKLGVQYLSGAGYDPRAMATVLYSLAAQNSLDAALHGRNAAIPEWASTHPDPASRVNNALSLAGNNATGATNRDTFLTRIDGIMYGDDPKQGVVEDRKFLHPELRFAFEVPQGYTMANGARSVAINGQSGRGEMSMAAYSGNLDSYIRAVFSALAGEGQTLAPASIEKTTVNGLPAAYGVARVNSGSGQVDVVVFAYEFAKDRAYHFTTISPAGQSGAFNPMFQSMRRMTAAEAAAVKPRAIDVLTVRSGDTVQSLSARMAYQTAREERFRVLNGLGASDQVKAGQKRADARVVRILPSEDAGDGGDAVEVHSPA